MATIGADLPTALQVLLVYTLLVVGMLVVFKYKKNKNIRFILGPFLILIGVIISLFDLHLYLSGLSFAFIPLLFFIFGMRLLFTEEINKKSKIGIGIMLMLAGLIVFMFPLIIIINFGSTLNFTNFTLNEYSIIFIMLFLLSFIVFLGGLLLILLKEVKKILKITVIALILMSIFVFLISFMMFYIYPDPGLPERCNVGYLFPCEEYQIFSSDGTVRLVFTSDTKEPIENLSVINASWYMETIDTSKCSNISMNTYYPEDEIELICDFDESLFPPEGVKMKVKINMKYTMQGHEQSFEAELYRTIEP